MVDEVGRLKVLFSQFFKQNEVQNSGGGGDKNRLIMLISEEASLNFNHSALQAEYLLPTANNEALRHDQ
jgi:hypothetical protein